MKKAKWSYSGGYSTQAEVVDIEETEDGRTFIHAKRELRGEVLEYKLRPERVDNWEEIRDNEIPDSSGNEVDPFMDIPSYSKNDGGTWKAIDKDGSVLSSHSTHKELKQEYNVRKAVGCDSDEFSYELLYHPVEVE